jgi:hypothetical protein
MRNKSRCRIFRNIAELGLLLCLISSLLVPPAIANPQNDVEAKVQEAVNFIRNREISRGMAQLKELGSPAVPYVLDYVSREAYRYPLIKILLLNNFVSLTKGTEADAALIKFLADRQPELRGYAATELGERKVESAVPHIVLLLNDKANTTVIRDVNDHSPDVLVRDAAIGALELIAGIKLAKGKSKEKQAKAWLSWWQKQQRKMSAGMKSAI